MSQKSFSSVRQFATVTPSDTTLVTCKGLYIGGAGNVAVATTSGATAVTFAGALAGTILPIELKDGRVMSTNTTATNIVALSW